MSSNKLVLVTEFVILRRSLDAGIIDGTLSKSYPGVRHM